MLEVTKRARELRNNPTPAEKHFWEFIRAKKTGYKFLRQKPLRFYINNKQKYFIADFYCKELNLVIELDGKIHLSQKEYDFARSFIINEMGFKVIRFTNEEIFKNIEQCLKMIIPCPSIGERVAAEGGRDRGE